MIERPLCQECGKEIWAISKFHTTIGVENPTFLHAVCYERLKEFEYMYKDLCK